MKILKRILIVIVAIIALLLVIALFVKKEYTVEKQVTINKPKAEVFNYVKSLKNQDNYSKWNQMDPGMEKVYTGTDGTVGFVYAWDSKKEGSKGEQEIKKIQEGERIDTELRFKKPFEANSPAYMITETADGNPTTVKWGIHIQSPYPMNIMNLFTPGILGGDMQTSLDNLKVLLEKQ